MLTLPLSQLKKQYAERPDSVRKLLSVPAILWDNPVASSDPSWERTSMAVDTRALGVNEPVLFRVAKVPGRANPFSMGVTIGRVESNDIILDHSSVSRFHAYFQFDERAQKWSLTDADSKNGSWLDGVRLSPRAHVMVEDNAVIRLGEVSLRFLLPDSIWAMLAPLR